MMRRLIFAAVALSALTAAPAFAEVKSAKAGGFEVGGVIAVKAPPARVWAVLTTPDDWWSRDHRWFRNSTLSLDLAPAAAGAKRRRTAAFRVIWKQPWSNRDRNWSCAEDWDRSRVRAQAAA